MKGKAVREVSNVSWSERSLAAFPAGSNGEFNLPSDLATVIESGAGCQLRSADGREMADFSMGWGSVLIGHADPRIIGPVSERLAKGTNFATVTDASLRLAEQILELSPACQRLRFCASGTEATMYCLRLARAATGRGKVLRFEGAYHGAHDVGVTNLFPAQQFEVPEPQPSSAGLSEHENGRVVVAPFNDLDRTVEIIRRHASDLAAVIVEPLQRCVPPVDGFLEGLRQATTRHGIQLVFDEVVTGFRLALGGAQEYYGVVPDLVAYGKALGGGLPIGAFGGRREIMDLVSENLQGDPTYVWTASTLGGNPVSATAALATLDVLRQPRTYEHLHNLGKYLRRGMRSVLSDLDIDAQVLGDGPLAQIAFTQREPVDYWSTQHSDKQFARMLMLELFRRGIFLNPMGTKLYLSLSHNEAVCDELLEVLRDALTQLISNAAMAATV